MSLPLVSLTITTKNEEKNIAKCLNSLKKQTYPQNKIETIVVDNNSTDKTKLIAKKHTSFVFNFGPERSVQRNFGMLKKSHGKYLMFLDADMTLSPQLIYQAVNKLETKSLAALYIPEVIVGNSFWNKVRNFERSFYDATAIDCVRIIRKDIFIKTNGFDESLTGPEDWDLDKRIRLVGQTGLLKSPKAVIYHHEGQFNLKNYLAKKNYYAKSFAKYIRKWGRDDPDIKKQFGFYYRYLGVFLEKGKWQKILSRPTLFFGINGLRFLTGFVFLKNILSYYKKKWF